MSNSKIFGKQFPSLKDLWFGISGVTETDTEENIRYFLNVSDVARFCLDKEEVKTAIKAVLIKHNKQNSSGLFPAPVFILNELKRELGLEE